MDERWNTLYTSETLSLLPVTEDQAATLGKPSRSLDASDGPFSGSRAAECPVDILYHKIRIFLSVD